MTNFFKDREITHETEFNALTEIVFDACTVPLNVEIEKFRNEKVRRAVENALSDSQPINEGRNYVFLNGSIVL